MNQKGGVGKTTVTVNLGAALARLGKEVLLIDLDPQANLSIHLNVSIHELPSSIYDVLVGQKDLGDVVLRHIRQRLSLAPANIDLSGAEVELVNAVGRETLLRDALVSYLEQHPCDFVLFDCPPSLGILSLNALSASKEVFIPIQTEFFALQGLAKLLGVIELITKRLNRELRLSRVIPTLYDTRTVLSKEVLADIQGHFGDMVTKAMIRKNVRLAEAPSHGKTIFEYDEASTGSEDFLELAQEILGRKSASSPRKRAPRPARPVPARPVPAAEREVVTPVHVEPEVSASAVTPPRNGDGATESAKAQSFLLMRRKHKNGHLARTREARRRMRNLLARGAFRRGPRR